MTKETVKKIRKKLRNLRRKKEKLLEEYLDLIHKEDEIKKVGKYII